MRAPCYKSRRARRLARLVSLTETMMRLAELGLLLQQVEVAVHRSKHRSNLVNRQRRPWETYVKPMLEDKTFKLRFRMEHDDFRALVEMLRDDLKRDENMRSLRNGAMSAKYQVALTLNWLACGSMYEGMDGHVIARSTAYGIAHRIVKAINACSALDCKWPADYGGITKAAEAFRSRSSFGEVEKCVGAMDGLLVRMRRPTAKEVSEPNSYYSGHKRGFGMNFQGICDAQYRIIVAIMNCPGSQNDRTAFKFSGFDKLLKSLPPGYFIVGDAAYPSSDRVLVPYPGKGLPVCQDGYNYYQPQCRMAIEQTFGIMVRTWGILWRPMEVRPPGFTRVVNSVVRLHNYCRTRNVAEAVYDDGEVAVNAQAGLSPSGHISGTCFETLRESAGRPAGDQTVLSAPRESIRSKLEVLGMARPAHNIARNRERHGR